MEGSLAAIIVVDNFTVAGGAVRERLGLRPAVPGKTGRRDVTAGAVGEKDLAAIAEAGSVVEECLDWLCDRFGATIEARSIRDEKVSFPLPRELRSLTTR